MKNTVFYSRSKKDVNSPRFLKIMEKMPFHGEFIYYCVDPDPVTKKRNEDLLTVLGITDVPTMYVDGQKFVGKDAFSWLQMQIHQMQGGVAGNYPGAATGGWDEPYPSQATGYMDRMIDPQQLLAQQQMQQMQMQQSQPQMPMIPGVGQMPQIPGLGGRMMPPGREMAQGPSGPMLQGNGAAGSGESAGMGGLNAASLDSTFADPFAPTDITGINSCGLSAEQILTPIQTKSQDGGSRQDEELKKYAMMRDSMVPQQSVPSNIPGMNVSMQQMAMPPMQMRR